MAKKWSKPSEVMLKILYESDVFMLFLGKSNMSEVNMCA